LSKAAPGFHTLIAAQFFSALADNALLLLAMALLIEQGQAPFWVPLLKLMFTLSYVVLGPWVGAWADAWPKHKVMMWANGIKVVACLAMLWGVHPLLSFALAGLGAAIYAPAKYGLITEIEPAERLVKANGWIEVSTVCAALFGVMLGGYLVSAHWLTISTSLSLPAIGWASTQYAGSLALLLALYGLAALLNTFIPGSGKVYQQHGWHWRAIWNKFKLDQTTMWKDPMASISLSVTTLFWGVGATMQLLVLAWAQTNLQLSLDRAAYLQGATAIGVITGAAWAAQVVPLKHWFKVLNVGLLLGLLLPLMALVNDWGWAVLLSVALGAAGGFFVVPMNAMLQHRGVQLLSAGRSISVQNVNENASILVMMGIYSSLIHAQLDVNTLACLLGGLVAVGMGLVRWRYQRLLRLGLMR
jgi:MFS family permease